MLADSHPNTVLEGKRRYNLLMEHKAAVDPKHAANQVHVLLIPHHEQSGLLSLQRTTTRAAEQHAPGTLLPAQR